LQTGRFEKDYRLVVIVGFNSSPGLNNFHVLMLNL
jgi:hypothetical protein